MVHHKKYMASEQRGVCLAPCPAHSKLVWDYWVQYVGDAGDRSTTSRDRSTTSPSYLGIRKQRREKDGSDNSTSKTYHQFKMKENQRSSEQVKDNLGNLWYALPTHPHTNTHKFRQAELQPVTSNLRKKTVLSIMSKWVLAPSLIWNGEEESEYITSGTRTSLISTVTIPICEHVYCGVAEVVIRSKNYHGDTVLFYWDPRDFPYSFQDWLVGNNLISSS